MQLKRTVILVLLSTLLLSVIAYAQEVPLWELTQVATVDELGIRFNVPEGWVTNGFTFAENPSDLEAITDTEVGTQPSGFVMLISGLPLTAYEDGMPLVEQSVNEFLLGSDANVSEYQYGTVNLRPSISLSLIGSDTQTVNLFTFWIQENTLITLQLITPTQTVEARLVYTWEQIITSVHPILPENFEFSTEPYEVTDLGFSIQYPEEWYATNSRDFNGFGGVAFSQIEGDIRRELPRGVVIALTQDPNRRFTAFGSGNATPNEVIEATTSYFQEIAQWEGEFNVLGERGIAISYRWACCEYSQQISVYHFFLLLMHDQTLDMDLWFQFFAPSEESHNLYLPVFFRMLQSIEPLEN